MSYRLYLFPYVTLLLVLVQHWYGFIESHCFRFLSVLSNSNGVLMSGRDFSDI